MNAESAHGRSRKTSGRGLHESSQSTGCHDELRAEIRGRATAILAELQADHVDWETVSELALGAHERIEAAL